MPTPLVYGDLSTSAPTTGRRGLRREDGRAALPRARRPARAASGSPPRPSRPTARSTLDRGRRRLRGQGRDEVRAAREEPHGRGADVHAGDLGRAAHRPRPEPRLRHREAKAEAKPAAGENRQGLKGQTGTPRTRKLSLLSLRSFLSFMPASSPGAWLPRGSGEQNPGQQRTTGPFLPRRSSVSGCDSAEEHLAGMQAPRARSSAGGRASGAP